MYSAKSHRTAGIVEQVRAISYGGGVQSTALLVLAAERRIDFDVALFSNVGADSENPATLEYFADVAEPYCRTHGIELVELHKIRRTGESDTIMRWIDRNERSIPIPMRLSRGKPGNRTCTAAFKIDVIRKELVRRGTTKANPAILALGISLDEYQRMKPNRDLRIEHVWPLIDLRMDRNDCTRLIERAGLAVPPKSSCYFCPFKKMSEWKTMRVQEPDLFAKSVALERKMNERRASLGRDAIWLTAALKPIDEAVADASVDTGQLEMFGDGAACDVGGYCHG